MLPLISTIARCAIPAISRCVTNPKVVAGVGSQLALPSLSNAYHLLPPSPYSSGRSFPSAALSGAALTGFAFSYFSNTGFSLEQMLMQLMQSMMNKGPSQVPQDLVSSKFGMSMQDAVAVFSDQTNNIWANTTSGNPKLLTREYLESIADGTAKGKFTDQEVAAVKTFLASPAVYEKIETAKYKDGKFDGDISAGDVAAFRGDNRI